MVVACACRTIKVTDPIYGHGMCARCGQLFRPVPHPSQRQHLR